MEGTGWTNLWVTSGIITMVSLFNFILLMLGTWFLYPRIIGTFLNCCAGCFFLMGVSIATLFNQLHSFSDVCSYNIAPVDYKGAG